jgi:hypothetical protein
MSTLDVNDPTWYTHLVGTLRAREVEVVVSKFQVGMTVKVAFDGSEREGTIRRVGRLIDVVLKPKFGVPMRGLNGEVLDVVPSYKRSEVRF